MTKKQRGALAIAALKELYPDAICSLTYQHDYELLIAVRLSAQCTDARVNLVTPILFSKYPTLDALANADIVAVQEIVKPCGLGKTKGKDIVLLSKKLIDTYNRIVPDTMDALLSLPGIGRKTANLILGDIYGQPAVVTDTHCIRISNRIGLTDEIQPHKVELQLKKILDPIESNDFCHRLVLFGRDTCTARRAHCEQCLLSSFCRYWLKQEKKRQEKK